VIGLHTINKFYENKITLAEMIPLENFHVIEYDDLTFDVIYNFKLLVCRSLVINKKILIVLLNDSLGMLNIID
jgi:hypothetical protein